MANSTGEREAVDAEADNGSFAVSHFAWLLFALLASIASLSFDLIVAVELPHAVLFLLVAREQTDFLEAVVVQEALEYCVTEGAGASGYEEGLHKVNEK